MILTLFASEFSPEARILLVGVQTHTGEFHFWKGWEGFLEYFLGTDDKIVVGFNILKFDISPIPSDQQITQQPDIQVLIKNLEFIAHYK